MNSCAISADRLRAFQSRIFWLLWSAYASYYLCRVNFAVAQPALLKTFPLWTSAQIGTIPSIYAAAYAIGQIVNGTLGQRYGARRLMTVAMLGAGLTNILFAFASSFAVMRLLWAVNGWSQSAGWALLVGTFANWHTDLRRGTLIGRLSTCSTVGNVASWLLAGFLCDAVGWRVAFLAPGLFMFPMAAVFFLFLRDSPESAGFPPVGVVLEVGRRSSKSVGLAPSCWGSTWQMLKLTLSNHLLWILAASYLVMNAVRYSFMNWTVQYLTDFHGLSIQISALTAVVVPLFGSLGSLSAGWVSDAFFRNRRVPVCVFMMLGLAIICGAMTFVPKGDWQFAAMLLALAGFLIYGPDMLLSGPAVVDLSHPRAGSMAAGMIMCSGALGAIFSGVGIGYLKDLFHGEWVAVFWVLAAMPLLPALMLTTIWHACSRPERFSATAL